MKPAEFAFKLRPQARPPLTKADAEAALAANNGNQTRAAASLGIDRNKLIRLLKGG